MKFGGLLQRGLSPQNLDVGIFPAPWTSISSARSPLPLSSQRSGLPSGSFPDTDPETASVKSSFNESPCVDIPLNAAPSNTSNTSNTSIPHSFPQKVAPNFSLISRRSVLQGGARCALGGMAGATLELADWTPRRGQPPHHLLE
ncbi:MAG: hypothetical protein WCK17_15090 [Verrucomicrobiota bacterium]